ncbi:hypothetical protein FGADI_3275 [Fusarium gaditjirri]|uniref:Helicase n=1 Tax=Fusarium gaditjirri TaxID=282569 RepID=A0A8H4TFW6_9HYPO|nr:hypothetical protein FGADI_3275 [Fusarium gaditjirri]
MSNLRDLLNPVCDDQHDLSSSVNDWLGVEQDHDLHMGDAPCYQDLRINGSIDEISQTFWSALNEDVAEASNYLQSSPTNTLVDPLFQQSGVPIHHQTHNDSLHVDPQLGITDFDIDFNTNGTQMAPHDDEENASSNMSTTLESFQFLQLPTESSREGSAKTPDSSVPSRPNATPISIPEDDDVMVHYGMLHNIEVKLVPNDMSSIDKKLAAEASAYQYFVPKEHQKQLMLCFPGDKKQFGHLPLATGHTLLLLMTQISVDIQPLALKYDLREIIHRANKLADARVKVDINIYGLRSKALDIGRTLSNGKLWLQRSSHGRHGVAYENPHFLDISIQDTGEGEVQNTQLAPNDGVPKRVSKEDQLRKMVDEVYKTVENNREIEMVEGGDRVRRQLLRHQKEALGFMLERESGHIKEKYRLWEEIDHGNGKFQYRHRITKRRKGIRPEERGGGILADDMGMGKSLSILALIMKTLDDGETWAEGENAEHKSRRSLTFSRSTLVVVSAALLVDEWMNEVRKHLQRGLKLVKYHGENRPKTLEELSVVEDSDIVVTTYHTLTAEYLIGKGKTSPLYKLGWYRIVLDEGEWCLSGTPIQNKLADIGSLFRFIRAEPFDKASEFRKWIETPFDNSFDDPEVVRNRLVMLLEALCLRRTREVLNLPKTRQFVRHLEFSPQEREQYEKTKAVILRNMEHRLGEVKKSSQFGMFQMWLQLRIVCNHGTYQKLFSWHRRSLLEEREAIVGTAAASDGIALEAGERPRKRRKAAAAKDDHRSYFNEEGLSTKIQTLVEDVQKDLWTTKSPLPQRQATLLKFENEDETPVLIMTTGTGAFGLNLTCANRIFIAELQWNPSVESQAISRAIRLGQQSEVRVTRYIIKSTVEEDIRKQQEYKKQIASLGFEEEIY